MDILKDIALSPSLEHYHLIVFIATLSALIAVPYMCFVLGAAIISLRFETKGQNEKDADALQLAYAAIAIAVKNKTTLTLLGIIPSFSLVFTYAQMVKSSASISTGLAASGALFAAAGLFLLYSYKYTFRVQGILQSYQLLLKKQKDGVPDLGGLDLYEAENAATHHRTGSYGIACLAVGLFLFSAAQALTADPRQWETVGSVFDVLFMFGVWTRFLVVSAVTAGMTGFGLLFFGVGCGKIANTRYEGYLVNVSVRLAAGALLILPVALLVNTASLTNAALSGIVYSLTGIALVVFFIAAHFIYGYHRTHEQHAAIAAFFLFLVAIGITIANEFVGIGTATRTQAAALSVSYEKDLDALKAKYGAVAASMTGEDIYNAKCSACHLFDQKKIGPPYFETIPKYKNHKSDLVAFILSPSKKDPAYPSMPNQGLKPAEADSIANYLLMKIAQAGK